MNTTPDSRIAMVGAGVMGLPMARHLAAAGRRPLVWVRSDDKRDLLAAEGLDVTTQLADLGECNVVVSCLLDEQAIREVYFSEGGICTVMPEGSLVIEHATVAPEFAREVANALAAHEIHFADAPISGGPSAARDGTLSAMVGCADEHAEQIAQVLRHTCSSVTRVGDVGAGETLKLVNQFLVAAHSVAAAEAAVLLRDAQVDPELALRALSGGWAASRRLDEQLVDSVNGVITDDGAGLGKFVKDLDLVGSLVRSARLRSELLPGIVDTWMRARDLHPEASFAALAQAYEHRTASNDSPSNEKASQ